MLKSHTITGLRAEWTSAYGDKRSQTISKVLNWLSLSVFQGFSYNIYGITCRTCENSCFHLSHHGFWFCSSLVELKPVNSCGDSRRHPCRGSGDHISSKPLHSQLGAGAQRRKQTLSINGNEDNKWIYWVLMIQVHTYLLFEHYTCMNLKLSSNLDRRKWWFTKIR